MAETSPDAYTYLLTPEDLDFTDTRSLPVIRAARNPNPAVLPALLKLAETPPSAREYDRALARQGYSANAFVPGYVNKQFELPLSAAIEAGLTQNVATLLANGARPDGYPLTEYLHYADQFLKHATPWSKAKNDVATRLEPTLTPATLKARSETFTPFWLSANRYVPLDRYRGGNGMTTLEVASKHSSGEILDMVLSASPDVSFWTAHPNTSNLPDFTKPSALSVTNPLVCAITHRRFRHVRTLLTHGLNPNTMPAVTRQQCYSPLMACFCGDGDPDLESFTELLAHPLTDRNLVTPILKVHVLHFVAARLSQPLLERVLAAGSFDLNTILPNAAGLTILHVACLPLHITYVNIFDQSIYTSFHESRMLPGGKIEYQIRVDKTKGVPLPQSTDFFPAQTELVMYLISATQPNPQVLLSLQDCHGNTALHYLAMHRTINQALLTKVLGFSEHANIMYSTVRNAGGFTAKDFVENGKNARFELSKPYWRYDHIK